MKYRRKPDSKRFKAIVVVVVFVVILGALAILNVAWPKKSFSENENRVLATFPEFSWDNLIDGKFTNGVETYVTDHFAFRDVWVGTKTMAEMALLKKDSGGVYFAKDGYLIEMLDQVDRSKYTANLQYVKGFAESMKSKFGIDVRTMLVPTASYTLRDKLPPFAPEVNQDELIQEAIDTIPNFVDVRQALKEHNQEYIYYRTDHHWTNLGVCYAYQVWCQAVGLEVKGPDWYEQKVLSDQFYGTTYSKANLYTAKPDTITAFLPKQETSLTVDYNLGKKVTDTLYETKYLDTKDKYSVFLDGNQPITKITTGNKNGRKLMLIKDSYANSFATFAANDYEEVHLVDLRHYRAPLSQLVEETGINEILVLYNVSGFASDANLSLLTR